MNFLSWGLNFWPKNIIFGQFDNVTLIFEDVVLYNVSEPDPVPWIHVFLLDLDPDLFMDPDPQIQVK